MRIGFVGLGRMGAPMAQRLVRAGHEVVGADPAPAARAALESAGGRTVVNAADAAAELVILMLPNSSVVASVMTGGLTEALSPGSLVIDMSSSEPLATRELAAALERIGIGLVDAPVSGGVSGAEKGTLTIMAGGDEASVARATEVIETLGSVRRVGAVGAGHAVKAFNNLLSATHLASASEAILAAQRFGLDPAVMLEAINSSSGRSGSTENKWPNFILPGSYDSGFALSLMLKDMRIATGLAAGLGADTPLADRAVELWSAAADALPPDADHTEIARWMAEQGQDST
ncbi:NAD(P)-dependent oxidoreductase [Okibacterium endophyticum]